MLDYPTGYSRLVGQFVDRFTINGQGPTNLPPKPLGRREKLGSKCPGLCLRPAYRVPRIAGPIRYGSCNRRELAPRGISSQCYVCEPRRMTVNSEATHPSIRGEGDTTSRFPTFCASLCSRGNWPHGASSSPRTAWAAEYPRATEGPPRLGNHGSHPESLSTPDRSRFLPPPSTGGGAISRSHRAMMRPPHRARPLEASEATYSRGARLPPQSVRKAERVQTDQRRRLAEFAFLWLDASDVLPIDLQFMARRIGFVETLDYVLDESPEFALQREPGHEDIAFASERKGCVSRTPPTNGNPHLVAGTAEATVAGVGIRVRRGLGRVALQIHCGLSPTQNRLRTTDTTSSTRAIQQCARWGTQTWSRGSFR